MAGGGVKMILSQSRRHSSLYCYTPFPLFQRHLSSDVNQRPPPPSIQPVSYPAKPEPQENDQQTPPPPPPTQHQEQQQQFGAPETQGSNWTREDLRYIKDAHSVSPVSYPSRVAPLPEARSASSPSSSSSGMERESRWIDREKRNLFRVAEEQAKVVLPFPRLIQPVRKEKKPIFDLKDALREIKANARNTFDETLEAHVRLGIDGSRTDLTVRGRFTLPHGASKGVRVAVFAEGTEAEEARAAGADVVGGVEFVQSLTGADKLDFEHCLTTPQFMTTLQSGPLFLKLVKVFKRHGLKLDSKEGTVVSDVARAVKEAKSQIKFRMDKGAIVHAGLGKVSLPESSLRENIGAFMNALLEAKPAGLKKSKHFHPAIEVNF
ncbi:hypothetical protein Tsubulata_039264 [Turnera subulata]|uniref:Ribosomal protein n=1 Tax=Turnera subulata TaxID=218843 RepID=A0A9Q0G6G8_9ROSI|nr:hypothetical protein Tsubulata_006066 [Turnera subulata]KAJ4848422.1 hypothetical protein Tsubulata_039264 [Turnera subulata]